ncbi:hypothetical protein [Actinomycetospora straminea]|uniref:DUF1440 domain-containing protein n=1 Tax=Actinomycetospora straminea TaxID=663607 RepID=A0ABP9EZR1_9PSEU|nr:hypothetical protein [Actinomycetospora straminea]MDD7935817.1 hypothetical protein [Actinomycetospora straminea]
MTATLTTRPADRLGPADRTVLALGRGALAGLLGTAAMTVSSTIEMRLQGRGASTTPAQAVAEVTGVRPADDDAQQRLNTVAHWGYGTAWGLARGALDLAGRRGPLASVIHLAAVLGAEQVMMPALGLGSPTPRYGASAAATDALHHVVYAGATGLAYDALAGR